jgi:hypothetical protein
MTTKVDQIKRTLTAGRPVEIAFSDRPRTFYPVLNTSLCADLAAAVLVVADPANGRDLIRRALDHEVAAVRY